MDIDFKYNFMVNMNIFFAETSKSEIFNEITNIDLQQI